MKRGAARLAKILVLTYLRDGAHGARRTGRGAAGVGDAADGAGRAARGVAGVAVAAQAAGEADAPAPRAQVDRVLACRHRNCSVKHTWQWEPQ